MTNEEQTQSLAGRILLQYFPPTNRELLNRTQKNITDSPDSNIAYCDACGKPLCENCGWHDKFGDVWKIHCSNECTDKLVKKKIWSI